MHWKEWLIRKLKRNFSNLELIFFYDVYVSLKVTTVLFF